MTTTPTPTDALMADLFGTIAQSHGLDPDIGRAAAMRRHPTSFAAYQGDDAAVVPISAAPSYRARHVVRDQLGLGGRS